MPDEAEASLVPENESLEQEWMYTYNTQRLMEKFTIMCKPELATINQRDELSTNKQDSWTMLSHSFHLQNC